MLDLFLIVLVALAMLLLTYWAGVQQSKDKLSSCRRQLLQSELDREHLQNRQDAESMLRKEQAQLSHKHAEAEQRVLSILAGLVGSLRDVDLSTFDDAQMALVKARDIIGARQDAGAA